MFADDIIVYLENPIDSTKKILDLISECGKTAGHKVNIEKLKTYLYTKTETSEVETRKIIPFAIATRKISQDGVDQWIEHWPANQRVSDLISSYGICLGCRQGPQHEALKRQPRTDISLSLFLPPFPSLKINK